MKTLNIIHSLALGGLMSLMAGCAVHHVPKCKVSASNLSDLHGSQPIDIKAGACSTTEEKIGQVGMGKVVGKMSEWTEATVAAVRNNLTARGATITAGAPKSLTITMTSAHVSAIPMVGVSTGKIVLTATTPEGLNSIFEGSSSSMAPLSAVNGAMSDAVKKLLSDSAVDAYLRK